VNVGPSREVGYTLPQLRPLNAIGGYADSVDDAEHEADIDAGILKSPPRQPLIDPPASVQPLKHMK